MVAVYSPRNEAELIHLRAVLDAAGVPIFVVNDHCGSMRVEAKVAVTAAKTICVKERDVGRARDLIQDYLTATTSSFRSGE